MNKFVQLFNGQTEEWIRDYVMSHLQTILKELGEFTGVDFAVSMHLPGRTARFLLLKFQTQNKIEIAGRCYRRDSTNSLQPRPTYRYKEDGWLNTKAS